MTSIGVATRALRRIALLAALTAGLTAPFAAHAEFESGWYIGGGAGTYSLTEVDPGVAPQLKDEGAIGTQIFGGYQFKYLAVEAGYLYLNDLTGQDGGIEVSLHLDGWFGRGLVMFPFEFSPSTSVAIFAGGGAHNWKVRQIVIDKNFDPAVKLSDINDSDTGSSVTTGVWIRGRRAATRLAYDLFTFSDSDDEISLWSVNFIYHF